jgi:hypothetical protein
MVVLRAQNQKNDAGVTELKLQSSSTAPCTRAGELAAGRDVAFHEAFATHLFTGQLAGNTALSVKKAGARLRPILFEKPTSRIQQVK